MCGITVGVVPKDDNNNGSGSGSSGDRITALGTVTRLLNVFTFSTGFAWTIQANNYANVIPFVNNVLPATVDYHRTDIAYLNSNNQIIFASGIEDLDESLAPIVPPNCLLLCTWNIFGNTNTIGNPDIEPVVTGEGEKDFLPIWLTPTKLGKSRVKQSGAAVIINPNHPVLNGNTHFSIQRANGQAQLDFVIGNPGYNQPCQVISNNDVDGLEIISYGSFAIFANKIKRLFFDKTTGTATLVTATNAKIAAEPTGKAIVTREYLEANSSSGIITVTKAALDVLIANGTLVVGKTYNITDADVNLYGGTSIFLEAVSTSKISQTGTGLFYNPIYNQNDNHNGVWNLYIYPTMTNLVGQFATGEFVETDNSATGIYLADGFVQYTDGNWMAATSMTGSSGATCDISDGTNISYAIDDTVIYGGKKWINTTGNNGDKLDDFTLDAEWDVIPFDDTNYNLVAEPIEYDVDNDLIIYRKDKSGNEVRTSKTTIDYFTDNLGLNQNPIKYLQWGNDYDYNTSKGNKFNGIDGGLLNNINFCGASFNGITLEQNAYFSGITLGQNAYFLGITLGQNATFSGITLGQNASFNGITLGQEAAFSGITLGQEAYFSGITLGQNATFSGITLGQNASFNGITLGQNASFNGITLGQEAAFSGITLGQNATFSEITLMNNLVFFGIFLDTNSYFNLSSSGTISNDITSLNIQASINFTDNISAATDIYGYFTKTISKRQDGTIRLSYLNALDVMVYVNPTA